MKPISIIDETQRIDIELNVDDITLEDKIETLPKSAGVYQFKNATGKVIYVGKAKVLRSRVRSYFQSYRTGRGDAKLHALVSKIADVELILTDSPVEALILENTLIKEHRPRYNIMFRDDKSYPFIVVTDEPYPRVFSTRKIRRDGSKYFGPYPDGRHINALISTIREVFQVRTCMLDITEEAISKKKFTVCLEYHIKKCEGPCEGLVSAEYYKAMINDVRAFLNGKTRSVIDHLTEQMHSVAAAENFERATELRNRIDVLRNYAAKQKVVTAEAIDRDIIAFAREDDNAVGLIFFVRDGKLNGKRQLVMTGVEGKEDEEIVERIIETYYSEADFIPAEVMLQTDIQTHEEVTLWLSSMREEGSVELVVPKIGEKAKLISLCEANARFVLGEIKLQKMKNREFVPHSLKALERDLRLKKTPRRIECFDNSHFQGSETVSSMVVFENAKPKKSEYRKYKIQTVEGVDDFKSMQEVVGRRYRRVLEEKLPLPDLIVIDGGKGQLSAACEVLAELGLEKIPVIGLAKRLEEIFVPGASDPLVLPKTSSGLRLLQQVRDEAHRFAITFHRSLRDKRTLQTELTQVPGIGEKIAQKLLRKFGSVEGVKAATKEQLAKEVGEKTAERLLLYFGAIHN